MLSAYDKVPEGTKRRVRELFSSEASATSQNKALASEARRLIEAHRDEYPRLRPGEVLLAAAVLQQVDEGRATWLWLKLFVVSSPNQVWQRHL